MPRGVEVVGNDGLRAAIIDVDVTHDLFRAGPFTSEPFHLLLRDAQHFVRGCRTSAQSAPSPPIQSGRGSELSGFAHGCTRWRPSKIGTWEGG